MIYEVVQECVLDPSLQLPVELIIASLDNQESRVHVVAGGRCFVELPEIVKYLTSRPARTVKYPDRHV